MVLFRALFLRAMLKDVKDLVAKDLKLEFRQKYALFSVLLYVLTTVYVSYLIFQDIENSRTWNALFWIILIFASVQTATRSFQNDSGDRFWMIYQLASPRAIILSKIVLNTMLLWIISLLTYGFISIFMGNLIQNQWMFLALVLVGSAGFSAILTMVAGIATHTDQNTTLMAILSIPLLFPFIITLVKATEFILLSSQITDGFIDLMLLLLGLNVLVSVMSFILFPYLWRQ